MRKLITLLMIGIIGVSAYGQWTTSGNTIYTNSNEIHFNYVNNATGTIWLNKNGSGPQTRGHYYIKAFDYWGAFLHFVGTGDQDNERMTVTFDGKVGIGTTSPIANLHIPSDGVTIGQSNIQNSFLLIGNSSNGIGFDDNEIFKLGGDLIVGTGDASSFRLRTNSKDALVISSNGSINIASNTLKISNTGDAQLKLIADTDNVTESHNASILFSQDGELVQTTMGLCETGKDAIGNTLTSNYHGDNHFTINNRYNGSALQFAINNDVKGYFINNGSFIANYRIGIGTKEPDYELDVAGTIRAEEILVEANGNTADFVFEDSYQLKDLSDVESFIKTNKHLPDIPSATQMEEQGVNLAEMNKLLLQKVEELTLYAIDRKSEVKILKTEVKNQKIQIDKFEKERLREVEILKEELREIKELLLIKHN